MVRRVPGATLYAPFVSPAPVASTMVGQEEGARYHGIALY